MADRWSHPGRANRIDLVNPLADTLTELLIKILNHVEFYVVTTIARKAINAIGITDRLERFNNEHRRLFFKVDDPLRWLYRLFRTTLSKPLEILAWITLKILFLFFVFLALFLYFLICGCRHIEKKCNGNIALNLITSRVEASKRTNSSSFIDLKLDSLIKIDFVSIFDPFDPSETLRPHQFKLTTCLHHQSVMLTKHFIVIIGIALIT